MAATIRSTRLRTMRTAAADHAHGGGRPCARRRRTCRGASRPRCSRGPRPWRDGRPRGSGRRARAASGRATRQPGGRRSAISRPGPCPRRATRPRRPVPRARRRGRRRDAPGGQLGHALQQGLRRLGEDLHRDQTSRLLRRAELLARDLLDLRTDDEADGIGPLGKVPGDRDSSVRTLAAAPPCLRVLPGNGDSQRIGSLLFVFQQAQHVLLSPARGVDIPGRGERVERDDGRRGGGGRSRKKPML